MAMTTDQLAATENSTVEPELFRVEVQREESRDLLVLTGSIGPDAAVRLHQEALRLAAAGRSVAIDWNRAEHLSSCALQVLVALRSALSQRGLSLLVAADSPAVRCSLEAAGLSAHFPCLAGSA